jgi:hypothetical protein
MSRPGGPPVPLIVEFLVALFVLENEELLDLFEQRLCSCLEQTGGPQ